MASLTVSVFAPQAANDLGVAPSFIGVYASVTYVGAMLGSLVAGGFILRYGAIRFTQIVMLTSTVGLAMCVGAHWIWFVLSAFIFGLGYGPTTPASSDILSRNTPSSSWSLFFSIKQTGVPLGGALAGMIVPVMLLNQSWQQVALTMSTAVALGAVALEPLRRRFDRHTVPQQSLIIGNVVEPLKMIFVRKELRLLALVSFCFSATQQSFVYFLVTYLEVGIGWTTQAAGTALSVLGLSAVVGRIGWGALADRRWVTHGIGDQARAAQTRGSRRILAILALGMSASVIAAALFQPAWPSWMILVTCGIFGATGASWNGIYIAEITRSVSSVEVGHATGGALFVTFAGVVITPPIFGLAVYLSGGFFVPLAALGVLAAGVGLILLRDK